MKTIFKWILQFSLQAHSDAFNKELIWDAHRDVSNTPEYLQIYKTELPRKQPFLSMSWKDFRDQEYFLITNLLQINVSTHNMLMHQSSLCKYVLYIPSDKMLKSEKSEEIWKNVNSKTRRLAKFAKIVAAIFLGIIPYLLI